MVAEGDIRSTFPRGRRQSAGRHQVQTHQLYAATDAAAATDIQERKEKRYTNDRANPIYFNFGSFLGK